jgi:hypothetical protein
MTCASHKCCFLITLLDKENRSLNQGSVIVLNVFFFSFLNCLQSVRRLKGCVFVGELCPQSIGVWQSEMEEEDLGWREVSITGELSRIQLS